MRVIPDGIGEREGGMGAMQEYRLYLLGPDDGSFVEGVDLIAADDESAIAVAQQRAERHDIELWQGARWIAQVKCPRPG